MCCQLGGVHWHTLKFGVCYSLNLRPLHSYMLFLTDRPASSIRASSFVGSRIFGEQCGRIRLSQEQLVLQGYSHRSYEISLVEVGICLTNIYRKELMTFASSLPRGSYLHFHLKRRVGKRHFTRLNHFRLGPTKRRFTKPLGRAPAPPWVDQRSC